MTENWSFETKQIHAGQTSDATTKARALPIYQTTSYTFDSTDHAAALFGLAEPGNIYTRIMNPTQDAVEQRIAALEGGVAALLLSSGQAAETIAILNLAEAGDHIVSSPRLYGGTYNLFHYTLPKLGIEVSFVEDPDDLEQWKDAVRDNTKAFYGETISNPRNDVLDLPGISGIAHQHGLPLIVDNTVATPYLIRPPRARRGHRGAFGHQVPRRSRHGDRRCHRRRRHVRLDPGPPRQLHHAGPELPRRRLLRARTACVRPQGSRAAASRPRFGDLPVQCVPHRAGPRDSEPSHGTTRVQRDRRRAVPGGPPGGRVRRIRRAPVVALARPGETDRAEGVRVPS